MTTYSTVNPGALPQTLLSGENPDGSSFAGVPVQIVGGGGGGAVTIADGADVTQGAKADTAATSDTGTFSIVALMKRLLQHLTSIITNTTGAPVQMATVQEGADIVLSAGANQVAASALSGRQGVWISNKDTAINMRWGGSSVAANKGAILFPQSTVWVPINAAGVLYVAPESGTPTLSFTQGA